MHELELIRAAAEDVASAQVLLRERMEALEAIIKTAQDHGIPARQIAEASTPAPLGSPTMHGTEHLLVA